MTARRKSTAAAALGLDKRTRSLADLAPLRLNPTTVATAGILRAAFDAAEAQPAVIQRLRDVKGNLPARERWATEVGELARRSAVAYAAEHADDMPVDDPEDDDADLAPF